MLLKQTQVDLPVLISSQVTRLINIHKLQY